MDWFLKREGEVLQSLGVSRHGLLLHDVEKRFAEFGPNELQQSHGSSVGKIFFSQVKSPVVYVLIAALVVAFFLREWVDASVILVILVLNTLLGFFQEFKADRALEKLKELSSPVCRVLRDGKEVEVAAKLLVPGDIILLEAGMRVPADAYLLESWNVKVDESILTGESVPVKKSLGALSTIVPVAGRYNMVFASSVVTYGRGTAVVVETGMHTEVGKIAHLLETAEEKETPLQKKLGMLGKQLALLTVVVVVIVFVAGLLRGEPLGMMFLVAVSLAVAAIPEGLPAVVTISLSLGVKRMVRRNVLVRKLSSVETLGATTIICTDKTGTLTCNQMTVKRLFVNNGFVAVSGDGYVPVGSFLVDDKQVASSSFAQLLKVGLWCNDAKIVDGKVLGDPTEAALVVVAQKGGVTVVDARVDEVPFTSEAKFMATKYKEGKGFVWMVKGAPEVVLRKCSRVLVNGRVVKLSAGQRSSVLLANESMAHDALRVLAFAYGSSVDDLILVGLMGMVDPPRPTVTDAVARCKSAGIRVVMITGDHRLTAQAIARQIGLRDRCLTGEELDALDDASLQKIAVDVDIFARVSPEHKVRILELLRPGQVVAMTGDGVNDAPALKRADIGVAVGSATDVAKEAADMVLLDDDFSSLVVAVEEGRAIYDNIKKFVNYLLSSNLGEVLILFLAMVFGFAVDGVTIIPLLAVHLLWINLVTDGLPALALGADPADPRVMSRKPRDPGVPLLSKNLSLMMVFSSLVLAAAALWVFVHYLPNVALAQTMAFSMVVVFEMARIFMIHAQYRSPFFSNKGLLWAVAGSLALQVLVLYIPFLQKALKVVPLGMVAWGQLLLLAVVSYVVVVGVQKLIVKMTGQFD